MLMINYQVGKWHVSQFSKEKRPVAVESSDPMAVKSHFIGSDEELVSGVVGR